MVSRKLLAVLLSELQTVRVVCKLEGCGMVVELPTAKLATKYEYGRCPACRGDLVPIHPNKVNAIVRLAEAISDLRHDGTAGNLDIEFVLLDTSAE